MSLDGYNTHDEADISTTAVVVGAGHNGLIAAAYLARAGIDTVLIEARHDVGGCASTVTDLGARFNICNCDHTMIRAMPVIDDLDLANHGLHYLESEFSLIHTSHEGPESWVFHSDIDAHLEDLARTNPTWVDHYRRYLNDALPVARLAIDIARTTPSFPAFMRTVAGLRGRGAARLLQWSRSSALAVLTHYFDDWRAWMPAVATGPTVWGVHPSMPGTGLAAAGYATKHLIRTGRPVGGSGALTDAVLRSFEAAGGVTMLGRSVRRLDTDGSGVSAVVLDNDVRIRAQHVIAACDPQRVVHEWLDGNHDALSDEVRQWRERPVHDGYESKVDAVLTERPVFAHERWLQERLGREIDAHSPTTVVCPSPNDLDQAHQRRTVGAVAERPTMLVNIPTVLDPSMQLNPAEHVLSLEVLFTPYTHEWSHSTEPARWLELLDGLCEPGTLQVDRWRSMTPDRYEREFAMHRGHTPAFSGPPLHTLLGRQPDLTRHVGPVAGLHIAGAAAFPGAGIFGGAGRNAASRVLEQLGSRSSRN